LGYIDIIYIIIQKLYFFIYIYTFFTIYPINIQLIYKEIDYRSCNSQKCTFDIDNDKKKYLNKIEFKIKYLNYKIRKDKLRKSHNYEVYDIFIYFLSICFLQCERRHEYFCPEFDKSRSCSKGKSCPYPHKLYSSKNEKTKNQKDAKYLSNTKKHQAIRIIKKNNSKTTNPESRIRYYEVNTLYEDSEEQSQKTENIK